MAFLETQNWTKPNDEGMVKVISDRTIQEVFDDISKSVTAKYADHIEYFTLSYGTDGAKPFPRGLAVSYAITGGSEGHRAEVTVMEGDKNYDIATLKTFSGMDKALEMSNYMTKLLFQEEEL